MEYPNLQCDWRQWGRALWGRASQLLHPESLPEPGSCLATGSRGADPAAEEYLTGRIC
jgi:hypothetical protein